MTTEPVRSVGVAEAKARLSELLTAVENGDVVSITRRGKSIASLVAAPRPRRAIDREFLAAAVDGMRGQAQDAGGFMQAVRDGARY